MMSEVNLNNSLPPVFYTKNDDTSQTEVKAQEEILPNVLEKFGLSKFQTHLESLKQWRFGLRAPDAATNFTHALKNLADGEEIWIPYTDEINIGFKKNSAKKFDITVINISANSCYHPFICINGELLSKTCMVKQNIPTDKLYDPIIIDRWLKESPKINQAQHLYENFLPFLGGQSVKFEEHFDKVDSCLNLETKGKLAIIRHKLRDDRARYKKLKLDFMQAKLAQISQLDTSDDHLAQISQHAKRVLKFSDQTDLQSKYYQQSKEVKNSLQPPNHNFAVEYLDSYEYESEIKPEKQKRLLCFDSVGNTFIEFEKWREDKNYHTFNPSGDLESVRNFIMENKIFSLPKLSDPFWETITTDAQIEAWIELLVYFYVHKTRRDKRGDSKNLSFFFLQAITDKLARQHSSLKKPLAGLDLFSKDNLVNFAYEPFNQQDNPYDQTILNDILTYHGLEDFDPARDGLKSLDSKVVFSRPKKTNYGYKFNRKVADLFTQRYTGKKDPKYTNQILIDGPEIPPLLSSLSKISYENSEQVKDGGVQVQPNFCLEKNFLTGSENISFSGKTNSSIKDNFGMPTPSGFIPQNYAMADKSLSNDITYNAADKVFRLIEHFSNDSFDDEKDQHRFKRAFLQGGMLQKSLAKEPRVAIALIDILSQTLENSNPNAEKTEPKIDILLSIQNDIVQHIQFAQHNYPVKYEKWQSKIDQLIDDYHLTLKKYRSEINSNQTIDAVKKLLAKNSLASESAKVVITGDAIEINDADRTYKLVKCNQYSYDVIWLKDDNEYFLYEPNSSFKDKKIWKCNKDSHHILEDKDGSLIYCNNEQYSQNLTSEIQFKWTKDIHKQHPFKGFANEGLVRYGKIHKADEASVNAFMLSNKLYFIEDNEKLKCELHPNFCFDTAATIKWRSKLQNPQLIALKSNDNREKILINGNSKPWSYYEYDVKQLESGEHILCPADSKSHLALIQNLMKSNQLVAAEKYIKTLNLVQGIDDDTKLILIDLLSTGQFTANCLVLKLRLMLELAKNLNFYGHQDHDEIKKNFQESIYNQYLQQKRFLTLDSLSKQEELQIINFIEKKTRAQQIRAEHLTSGKLKEQKSSRRPKPPIFSAAAASFIKSISFFHSTPRSMNARKIDLHNINIDALNVADNFDELQSIAIYGTKKQKASIKILVEFTTQTPKNRFRITYLKCLLSFPRLFPRLFFPYVFVGDKTKFLNYVALAPTGLFMTIHDLACNHIFTPNRAHSIEPILKFNPVNLKIETSTQTAEQLIDINENLFNSKIDTNVAAILNRLNRVPQNMQTDLRKISGEIKEANFEEALLLFFKWQNICIPEAKPLSD